MSIGRGYTIETASEVAQKSWPRDELTGALLRAAVNPASTANASALGAQSVGFFLLSMVQQSAAAALINRGIKIDLARNSSMLLPFGSGANAGWVGEGSPAPVDQEVFASVTLGPMRKISLIEVVSEQLKEATPESMESIVGALMRQSAARLLDTTLLDANAADTSRPAGLRFGVSAITATGGGGAAAALGDLSLLLQALVTGGGAIDPVVIVGPARSVRLRGLLPGFSSPPLLSSPWVPDTLLLMIDAANFASSVGAPSFDASIESTLHMEDTTPLAISTPGSPATVAAPTRSLFQTNSIGIRMMLDATWAIRPGAIAWVNSPGW